MFLSKIEKKLHLSPFTPPLFARLSAVIQSLCVTPAWHSTSSKPGIFVLQELWLFVKFQPNPCWKDIPQQLSCEPRGTWGCKHWQNTLSCTQSSHQRSHSVFPPYVCCILDGFVAFKNLSKRRGGRETNRATVVLHFSAKGLFFFQCQVAPSVVALRRKCK